MPRKTVKLRNLIETVNQRNRKSTCAREIRAGWNDLLCTLLLDAGAYCGFQYLRQADVPNGQEPGIRRENGKDAFPDKTRIRFFVHTRLTA